MTNKNNNKVSVPFDLFVALWNKQQNLSTPAIHIRIARWLEKSFLSGDQKLLLMAFRACGKSTLVGLFCAWVLLTHSDKRIIVLAADLPLARKMVRNVKRILERHYLTGHLKPEKPEQWGGDQFTINRDLESRDPSMLARSISANMTGSRADIMICDDVEVPNTCETVEKRRLLREKLGEIDYILTPGGLRLYVGTPHHYETIYADRPRKELGQEEIFLKDFKRFTLPILDENGCSVWPSRYSEADIEAIRIQTGPNKFASQMMLEPTSIARGRLDPDNLVFYEEALHYSEANGKPWLKIGDDPLVSVSCWWDPAFRGQQEGTGSKQGDHSVIACVFTGKSGQLYLHGLSYLSTDPSSEQDEATQQCAQVAHFLKAHYCTSLTIEMNGVGRFLPVLMRKYARENGLHFSIQEMSNHRPKAVRIMEAFDALLAARGLKVHAAIQKTPFVREMREWRPGTNKGHDDGLDAVAGALSITPLRLGSGLITARKKDWRPGSETYQISEGDFNI